MAYAHSSRFFFCVLLNQQECNCSTNFMMSNFNVLASYLVCIYGCLWRGWNGLSLIHSFRNCDCVLLTMLWFLISCSSSEEEVCILNTPINTGHWRKGSLVCVHNHKGRNHVLSLLRISFYCCKISEIFI